MTRASAANATGLPSNRRAFLGNSIAMAAALSAAAAPATAADAPHADAELFDWAGQLLAEDTRREALNAVVEAAYERVVMQPIPEALFWRETDTHRVCMSPYQLAKHVENEEEHPFYEDGVGDLNLHAQRYAAEGEGSNLDRRFFNDDHRARTLEIQAAHKQWRDSIQRAEDEAGVTGPAEAERHALMVTDNLRFRIASTPAKTPKGLAAKARAMASIFHPDEQWVIDHYLPLLLSRWIAGQETTRSERMHAIAISIIVDALTLLPWIDASDTNNADAA